MCLRAANLAYLRRSQLERGFCIPPAARRHGEVRISDPESMFHVKHPGPLAYECPRGALDAFLIPYSSAPVTPHGALS